MNPEHIIFAVCLLLQINNNSVIGTATGFFVEDDNKLFLVTNRHVVEDKTGKSIDAIVAKLRLDSNDLSRIIDVRIDLSQNGNRQFYTYSDKKIDIALIPIEMIIKETVVIKPIMKSHFPPPIINLYPGSDLITVGYPRAFTDNKTLSPIYKITTAATPVDLFFDGNPFFLMDGNLKKGMSGSPVFVKPSGILQGKDNIYKESIPKAYFVGIHSSTVQKTLGTKPEPVYKVVNNKVTIKEIKNVPIEENLELHTCFFNGIIFELIKSTHKN